MRSKLCVDYIITQKPFKDQGIFVQHLSCKGVLSAKDLPSSFNYITIRLMVISKKKVFEKGAELFLEKEKINDMELKLPVEAMEVRHRR